MASHQCRWTTLWLDSLDYYTTSSRESRPVISLGYEQTLEAVRDMVVAVAVTMAKLEKRPVEIETPIVISEPKTVSPQPPIAPFPHVLAIPPTVGWVSTTYHHQGCHLECHFTSRLATSMLRRHDRGSFSSGRVQVLRD